MPQSDHGCSESLRAPSSPPTVTEALNYIDVVSIRARLREIRDGFTVRPLDPDEDVVFIGFKVVESMAESLDDLAASRASNRSELIREAISHYLENQEVAASA